MYQQAQGTARVRVAAVWGQGDGGRPEGGLRVVQGLSEGDLEGCEGGRGLGAARTSTTW